MDQTTIQNGQDGRAFAAGPIKGLGRGPRQLATALVLATLLSTTLAGVQAEEEPIACLPTTTTFASSFSVIEEDVVGTTITVPANEVWIANTTRQFTATEAIVINGTLAGMSTEHGAVDLLLTAPRVVINGLLQTADGGDGIGHEIIEGRTASMTGGSAQRGGDVLINAQLVEVSEDGCIATGSGGDGIDLDDICPGLEQDMTERALIPSLSYVGGDGARGGDVRFLNTDMDLSFDGWLFLGNGGHGGDTNVQGIPPYGTDIVAGKGGESGRSGFPLVTLEERPDTDLLLSLAPNLVSASGFGGNGGGGYVHLIADSEADSDGQPCNVAPASELLAEILIIVINTINDVEPIVGDAYDDVMDLVANPPAVVQRIIETIENLDLDEDELELCVTAFQETAIGIQPCAYLEDGVVDPAWPMETVNTVASDAAEDAEYVSQILASVIATARGGECPDGADGWDGRDGNDGAVSPNGYETYDAQDGTDGRDGITAGGNGVSASHMGMDGSDGPSGGDGGSSEATGTCGGDGGSSGSGGAGGMATRAKADPYCARTGSHGAGGNGGSGLNGGEGGRADSDGGDGGDGVLYDGGAGGDSQATGGPGGNGGSQGSSGDGLPPGDRLGSGGFPGGHGSAKATLGYGGAGGPLGTDGPDGGHSETNGPRGDLGSDGGNGTPYEPFSCSG